MINNTKVSVFFRNYKLYYDLDTETEIFVGETDN